QHTPAAPLLPSSPPRPSSDPVIPVDRLDPGDRLVHGAEGKEPPPRRQVALEPRRLRQRRPASRKVMGGAVAEPARAPLDVGVLRSEEHTSELQSLTNLVCRLL